MTSSTTAATSDSTCSCAAAGRLRLPVSVGMISTATDSTSSSETMRGPSAEKRWVPCRSPPTMNASPSISSTFDRIEPTSEASTTVTSPLRSAKMPNSSSGILPRADCTTPVAPEPSLSPRPSTARPTTAASEASARAETTKGSTDPDGTNLVIALAAVSTALTPISHQSALLSLPAMTPARSEGPPPNSTTRTCSQNLAGKVRDVQELGHAPSQDSQLPERD